MFEPSLAVDALRSDDTHPGLLFPPSQIQPSFESGPRKSELGSFLSSIYESHSKQKAGSPYTMQQWWAIGPFAIIRQRRKEHFFG